jgi:two-component system phosphate regulon sensor histidine kinase PhoR
MPVHWSIAGGILVFVVTAIAGGAMRGFSHAIWVVAGSAALAAIAATIVRERRHAGAIDDIVRALRRVAAGELNLRVYAGGSEAIGHLARSVNAATDELATRFAHLETERRQLRAILGGMIEGVVLLDAAQNVQFVNDRAAQLLDLNLPATGKKIWEVIRHRRLLELVSASLAADAPVREELDWHGPTPRDLAAYATRLAGTPTPGAVLVLHDVTELHRLERVRRDFVANVSHELKTPLTVIKINVETLLAGAADDPNARTSFLEQTHAQAERLQSLILDLLSLAKIESGAATLQLGRVDLESVIRAELERHRPRAAASQQTLEAVAADDEAPVFAWADREAVATILDNLIDNALKYTPTGGRVAVRWYLAGEAACFEVEDTGIGIPESDQSRIFERFYRVDTARSRELGGTGLGLSIVKHLAQAMHGTVAVHSEFGRGSRFVVRLPAAARVPSASPEEAHFVSQ